MQRRSTLGLNFGRYPLGMFVPIAIRCKDKNGVPTIPDAAPQVTVYASNTGTPVIAARPLPQWGLDLTLFGFDEFLGPPYASAGPNSNGTDHYLCTFTYALSGVQQGRLGMFEVIAGGDPGGTYTSMAWFSRPQANFLVTSDEANVMEFHTGPSA